MNVHDNLLYCNHNIFLASIIKIVLAVYNVNNIIFICRLADKGHDVVGCEGVDLACREFFEEHDIPYTSEPLNEIDGVVYKVRYIQF